MDKGQGRLFILKYESIISIQFNSIQFYCPFLEMDNKRYFCSVSVHLKYFVISLSFELLLSSHLSLAKMSYGCSGDNGSRGMGVWVWIFHLVIVLFHFIIITQLQCVSITSLHPRIKCPGVHEGQLPTV